MSPMINNVRNTVLSVVNKDNRGYITPEEFNQYAKQSQLEIFEKKFYDYSTAVSKQNARLHGDGHSNIPAIISELIDRFIVSDALVYNNISLKFYMPGEDPGSTDPKSFKLDRLIYNNFTEIEKITERRKLNNILNSPMLAPTVSYPVYILDEQGISVYPTTITSNVTVDYIRYPYDPKWTYTTLSGGEPVFNQSATDYQDFELPESEETNLIIKICQYAGVSIREQDLVSIMKQDEIQDKQEKI